MSDQRVLLFTGSPRVGKTTVLRTLVAALPTLHVRGFWTQELRRGGERVGFRLRTADGKSATLAHVDLASATRVGSYGVDLAALDAVVSDALDPHLPADVIVIDEIGKMECLSDRFVQATRRLLGGPCPIIATVASRGTGLIAEVKRRPDVELWEITPRNRDAIPSRAYEWLERFGIEGLGPSGVPLLGSS